MNEDLHLHEAILLLGLNDKEGNFTTSLSYLNYGFASALLIDLVLEERIAIVDGLIKLNNNAITENKLLNDILEVIRKGKKPKKLSSWIHTLVVSNSKYIRKAIDHLIKQGILKKTTKKILWIFNIARYPTVDPKAENQLRSRLFNIIFNAATPQKKEILLLSILQACQMSKDLIPDKEELKMSKDKIKELTEKSDIKNLIKTAIAEMETMVTVVTTSAI